MEQIKSFKVLEEYHKCWNVFSEKQRYALTLYHGDGKSVKQIAKELKKAPSTVSELLKRAEARKKVHDLERRKEYVDLVRKRQNQ